MSALVLEAGGSESQAIAALLHDAAEDCGGQPRLDDIRHRFGNDVGDIVEACSDSLASDPANKAPREQRKRAYLAHLSDAPSDVLLVSLADKLHNAIAIRRDLHIIGMKVFDRFSASREQTLWYYGWLTEVFNEQVVKLTAGGLVLLEELVRSVKAIGGDDIAPDAWRATSVDQ